MRITGFSARAAVAALALLALPPPLHAAGGSHDAAPADARDQHRAPTQRRPGQLLDGREESVHVDV